MNEQKLQRFALVAEIAGGVAVIVTLVILIFEVNANTRATKAATYDALVADIANYRMEISRNEPLIEAEFIRRTEGMEALTPRQKHRREFSYSSLFLQFERAFIQWQAGNLDDEAWQRFHVSICRISSHPEFEGSVGRVIDQMTTASFQDYRKSAC